MVQALVRKSPRRLAEWVESYEAALAEHAQLDLRRFLPPSDHDLYLSVLIECIRIDLERGWRTGLRLRVDSVFREYPELLGSTDALTAVAFEEFRQRRLHGESATPSEYAEKYSIDTTQWPVESAADDSISRSASLEPHSLPSTCEGDLTSRLAGRPCWPEIGQMFAGFELLAELGRGAFARVFLSRQTELAGRPIVLKVSDRFLGESQTIAALQHTNIVPVYSQHREGAFHALCMPFFGSTTLGHVLAEFRTGAGWPASGEALLSTIASAGTSRCSAEFEFTPDESPLKTAHRDARPSNVPVSRQRLQRISYTEAVLWQFERLASALAHAHERGVLHLDLKPANVLLRDDGEPMMLDFNLSGRINDRGVSDADVVGGTLPYMAPEQVRAIKGERDVVVGVAADIYSLGVMLHEMLTGNRPGVASSTLAGGGSENGLVAIAGNGDRAGSKEGYATPAMRAIVTKCLAMDPADRYKSAADLAEDLRRQLEDLPLRHANNPSWGERCTKWQRRHPRVTSATSIGVLALAVLAIISTYWWNAERRVARTLAQERLNAFVDTSLEAQFMLAATDPSSAERRRGRELAMECIAKYDVAESNTLSGEGDVSLLSGADRERLSEELADLRAALAADNSKVLPSGANADAAIEGGDAIVVESAAPEHYRKARTAYSAGRFADVVELLSAAIARQPRQVRYWMLRGRAEEAQLHHADAEACFTACIVLKPDWAPAYVHRGAAQFRQGHFREAIADFDKAVELDRTSSAAVVNRALARQQIGDLTDAIADLDKAIVLEPERTRFYHLRARMHRRVGDVAAASLDEARAMSRDPDDAEGWITRGVYLVSTRPQEALAAFQSALQKDPGSLDALRNSAHVWSEHLNEPQRAIAALSRAIDLYPDCAPAVLGRGVLYARGSQRDASHADARTGLKLDAGAEANYQAACIFALTSRQEKQDADEAIGRLFTAVHFLGFDRNIARRDPDLAPIRMHPDFARIVATPLPVAKSK
jgi:serine/threonine protein kinase/Tfp pilus assembly protein PilF